MAHKHDPKQLHKRQYFKNRSVGVSPFSGENREIFPKTFSHNLGLHAPGKQSQYLQYSCGHNVPFRQSGNPSFGSIEDIATGVPSLRWGELTTCRLCWKNSKATSWFGNVTFMGSKVKFHGSNMMGNLWNHMEFYDFPIHIGNIYGTMEFYDFSHSYWELGMEIHHPKWLSLHDFCRWPGSWWIPHLQGYFMHQKQIGKSTNENPTTCAD